MNARPGTEYATIFLGLRLIRHSFRDQEHGQARQASKNRFWFNPAEEAEGTASDGVISVTLGINHPNEGQNTGNGTLTAVAAALTAADPFINYKAFDTDNNGYLSTSELHLVLVFAGYENAYSADMPGVWAHHWSLSSPVNAPLLDGVYVAAFSGGGGYAAVGENHGTSHAATIGVICHELGHNLALPDLYDTDLSSDGVGTHCLMGSGNWAMASGDAYQGQTPVLPSAYCRQLIGFSDVRTVSGAATVCPLLQVSDSTNFTDIVRLNTPNSQQYFLVENRQLTGFDAGLAYYFGVSSGGGLAVWHIDASMANNATDTRRLVDLEEAASPVLDAAGQPLGSLQNYYYSGNVTRFDETTSPGSALNGGGASLVRVTNVSAAGAQMTFTAEEGASLENALDIGVAQAIATGSPAWTCQTATTHDGVDAAQSGTVSKNSKTSYMETVVTGRVQVAFWWRNGAASTETFSFLVDNVAQASLANTSVWASYSQNVGSGQHTLRWSFVTTRSKSNQGSTAAAYVDQLTVTPRPPDPGTLFSVR